MEWTTVQHLDLRHVARGFHRPLQPHAAAFHPTQTLIAAAIGTYIIGNLLGFYFSCFFNNNNNNNNNNLVFFFFLRI
jgi:hypothetical protein